MACISCGLGVNADGKGRVDIDTAGGLKCTGSGGGLTNAAGSGLALKVATTTGNSVQVDANGLYVPRAFKFEQYSSGTITNELADPNYPTGSSVATATGSIVLDNTAGVKAKSYLFTVSCAYGTTGTGTSGLWFELNAQVGGGGWFAPGACSLPIDVVSSPLCSHPIPVVVAPGQSTTIYGRIRHYRGHMTIQNTILTAWGGYSVL